MKIDYVAFDSFGVKSSCIHVKTKDLKLTIDPGIACETGTFPLPWSKNLLLVEKYTAAIRKACRDSDAIAITHYHYDHYIPEPGIYEGKKLMVKDPAKNINHSQGQRAAELLPNVKAEINIADGKEFRFGNTKVKFSKPMWHGMDGTGLGKVLMVRVDEGKSSLLHTSDLNGIYLKRYAKLIADENPDILVLDGAPTYLLGYIMSFRNLEKCVRNLVYVLENTDSELYILDHHLLRDYRYRELYYEAFKRAGELKKKLLTARELSGKEPMVVEACRKYGPTKWRNWENLTFDKMRNSSHL